MNTTPTKPFSYGTHLAHYGLALLAVLLIGLTFPPLVSRLAFLHGDAIRDAMLDGDNVPETDVDAFLASRQGVSLFVTNETVNDIALAYFARAKQIGFSSPMAKPLLVEALKNQELALMLSPADTYGWARLAYLQLLIYGPANQAPQSLAMSLIAAPYEDRLTLSRLNTAMLLYNYLDAETKASMPKMLLDAWKTDSQATEALAKANHYEALLTSAISEDKPKKH